MLGDLPSIPLPSSSVYREKTRNPLSQPAPSAVLAPEAPAPEAQVPEAGSAGPHCCRSTSLCPEVPTCRARHDESSGRSGGSGSGSSATCGSDWRRGEVAGPAWASHEPIARSVLTPEVRVGGSPGMRVTLLQGRKFKAVVGGEWPHHHGATFLLPHGLDSGLLSTLVEVNPD